MAHRPARRRGRRVRGRGRRGYVNVTYLLTGETTPFNARVRPHRPLWSPASGIGWGTFEGALRYEGFRLRHDPDSPTASAVENRYQAFVAGLNWYPNEVMRFSLNYVYGYFDEAGPGSSPNPSKHSNNAVLSRLQVEF